MSKRDIFAIIWTIALIIVACFTGCEGVHMNGG